MTAAPPLSLIAAVAENGVIGRDNKLPWRLKSELQYFKTTTMGKPVVMGRKTFQSLGRPLPGRTNIVITRDEGFAVAGVVVVHSLQDAIAAAAQENPVEIFVIGGAEIYRQALPLATRLYLTTVHARPEGDTLFPALDDREWTEVKQEFRPAGPEDSDSYTLRILEKKQ